MFHCRTFQDPGLKSFMVQVLKNRTLVTTFHSESRLTAECFKEAGKGKITAYLGRLDGSIITLTFFNIGFKDKNPQITVLRTSTGHPVTHIVSDGSATLCTSECGITLLSHDKLEILSFQRVLRIWKNGTKCIPPSGPTKGYFSSAQCMIDARTNCAELHLVLLKQVTASVMTRTCRTSTPSGPESYFFFLKMCFARISVFSL
ncbi:hypothetical protein B0H10DRAFT_911028 [Mycena sp. CBHHK59/15]|nr:hypothetical protein B0H10DRAFT_911028 [Mycena sp. CBHHK59/15]